MFDPRGYENSRPDGFAVLEVVTDPLVGRNSHRFVPLKRTHLTGEIVGPLADLRLTQTFGYTLQECDQVLEALYRFPLPGDAAVTDVTVRFGDVLLKAELKERARAEAEYEQAKEEGRQATLATRESPDVFTLQVAGLKPDQEITVETAYVQLARREGSDWMLRIPLTTAPRYVREDEGNSRHTQGQPLTLLRDPGHRFTLDLNFRNAENITSPTHALDPFTEEDGQSVRLRDGEVVPDRDCVLSWRAQQADRHPALHLLLHNDIAAKQVYFLALVAPPRARRTTDLVPREAILLVDHSGSMEGAKWEAADWTVTRFLRNLAPQDTFALGLFHDSTRWFTPKPIVATPENVAAAVKYLRSSKESGGTNLGVALEQALGLPRSTVSCARHLLLVTDAEVSDAGRILRLASEEAQHALRRRIHVICIDAAPNALLATELAERGGGVSRFLTSDPKQDDITTALDTLLEDWSAPILTGLRLAVNRSHAEAVERAVESAAQQNGSWIDIGDLPAGRAIWTAGRVPCGDSADLSFRLTTEDGTEIAACRSDLEAASAQHPALKALFGARRVLGLEFLTAGHYGTDELRRQLSRLGYDPDSALIDPNANRKLYGENVQQDASAALRNLLARESLAYGLASAETAFVVVNAETGEQITQTVAVPSALPADWSDSFGVSAGFVACAAMAAPSGDICDYEMAAELPPPTASQQRMSRIRQLLSKRFGTGAAASPDPGVAPPSVPDPAPTFSALPLADARMEARSRAGEIFSGIPIFRNGEAVLFDSTHATVAFPDSGRLSRLEVTLPQGAPAALERELTLLLYADDLAVPRVRVRLADLMQQGGTRPLNLLRVRGQVVRLVLIDPSGVWADQAPELVVSLI